VNSDGNTFSDRFAPMAVHIYIAPPATRSTWATTFTRFREFQERSAVESLISPMENEQQVDLVDRRQPVPAARPAQHPPGNRPRGRRAPAARVGGSARPPDRNG
jgi:hypothetical protein